VRHPAYLLVESAASAGQENNGAACAYPVCCITAERAGLHGPVGEGGVLESSEFISCASSTFAGRPRSSSSSARSLGVHQLCSGGALARVQHGAILLFCSVLCRISTGIDGETSGAALHKAGHDKGLCATRVDQGKVRLLGEAAVARRWSGLNSYARDKHVRVLREDAQHIGCTIVVSRACYERKFNHRQMIRGEVQSSLTGSVMKEGRGGNACLERAHQYVIRCDTG